MHSSFRRGREHGSDRYRDHGRGTLRGERQRHDDADGNLSWTIAALDRRHGGAAKSAAAPILETSGGCSLGLILSLPASHNFAVLSSDVEVSSAERRFSVKSASTGICLSHLVVWPIIKPAAIEAV